MALGWQASAHILLTVPRYLDRPQADAADADPNLALPYGLSAAGIVASINDLYAYLHALNAASIEHGYDRLEDIMLPAGFSGLLSELFVRAVAKQHGHSQPGIARNQRPGGRPDLVPRAVYPGDSVHRGEEGVEVKASGNATSWQGHNPETGWLMVVQVKIDRLTSPVYDRAPTEVLRVLIANLVEADWTYSGRSAESRRTPTASINRAGRDKLSAGTIFEKGRSRGEAPPADVGPPRELEG